MSPQTRARIGATGVLVLVACSIFQDAQERSRFYVTSPGASLVEQGLAAAAPDDPQGAGFRQVSAPGIQSRPGQAQATEAPWINSNGWRFQRGLKKAHYATLPAGSAALAAAEAFAFDAEAILNPDAADVDELAQMLRFVKAQERPRLPVMANVAVVDDRSPLMDEVLNMLTRRNLLYRVVSAPERALLNVQLDSAEFPREAARNPSDFAARVREKIGDDNRLVRVYGTSTLIAHLTGDRQRARLFLVAYAGSRRRPGRSQQHVRLRVLGRYEPASFAAFGAAPDAKLTDVDHPGDTTEFSLPPFSTLAIVELTGSK